MATSWRSVLTLTTLLLGVGGTPGVSKEIVFQWDYAGADQPAWHLFYTRMSLAGEVAPGNQAPQMLSATECQQLSAQHSCAVPGNEPVPYTPGQTQCGKATCPGPGAYTFGLRIEGQSPSPNPEDLLLIGFDAQCKCIPFETALTAVEAPPPPPSTADPTTPAPIDVPPSAPVQPPATPPAPAPPGQQPPATNLLPPPTETAPWASSSFGGSTGTTRHENGATLLTGTGAYYTETSSPRIAVEPGGCYEIAAWVKLEGITEFVEMEAFWFDAHGRELNRWEEAIGGQQRGTQDWTSLAGTIHAPPQATQAMIQVRVRSTEGQAWVRDDLTMQACENTPPPVAAVPGAIEEPPAPPAPPAPIPKSSGKRPRAELRNEFARVEREYLQAQTTILTTYEETLRSLQRQRTRETVRHAQQARTTANKALRAAYQALLDAWKRLIEQW